MVAHFTGISSTGSAGQIMFDRWISKLFNFGERVVVKLVDVELNADTIPSTVLVFWPFPIKERKRGLTVVLTTWSPIFQKTILCWNCNRNTDQHWIYIYIWNQYGSSPLPICLYHWFTMANGISVLSKCKIIWVHFHWFTYSFYFVFVIFISIACLSCTNTVEQIKESRN